MFVPPVNTRLRGPSQWFQLWAFSAQTVCSGNREWMARSMKLEGTKLLTWTGQSVQWHKTHWCLPVYLKRLFARNWPLKTRLYLGFERRFRMDKGLTGTEASCSLGKSNKVLCHYPPLSLALYLLLRKRAKNNGKAPATKVILKCS